MKAIKWYIFIIGTFLLLPFMWGGTAEGSDLVGYAPDQLIVKLATDATIADINSSYGTTTIKPLINSSNIYLLQLSSGSDGEQLLAQMSGDSRLLYADLNVISTAPEAHGSEIYAWPEETQVSLSPQELSNWEISGSDVAHYTNQTALQHIDLFNAWSVSYGDGVTVAVLDTGVDVTHPVLVNSLVAGYDFVDDDSDPSEVFDGIDDDGDGYIDEVAGHGTHVAGIVHLVAPYADIMPLRVLDSDGQGNAFVIAEAILYAAANGADVINLSLGTVSQTQFMADVIAQTAASGVLIVGAAGNMDMDVSQYPAASSCALGVTAVTSGKKKTDYASYGSWVNVAGPGQRIYSTFPGGEFAWWQGTSMATPFVAGQAALLLGYDSSLTLEQLGLLIAGTTESGKDRPYENMLGTGRINAGASMAYLYYGVWPSHITSPLQGC